MDQFQSDDWISLAAMRTGSAVAAMLVLLDSYGAAVLQAAIAYALQQPSAGTSTVRQFLESQRRNAGLPPLGLAVPLPSTTTPTTVVHKAAADYDQLAQISAAHHKEPHHDNAS